MCGDFVACASLPILGAEMNWALRGGRRALAGILRCAPGSSLCCGPVRQAADRGESENEIALTPEREGLERTVLGGDAVFEKRLVSFRCGRIKSRSVSALKDGRFFGRGWGAVVEAGDVLRLDLSPAPGVTAGMRRGHPVWERVHHPTAITRAGNVAVLTAPQADNFHHWLLDCVPRAGMLAEAGYPPASWDFVVVPESSRPWHREGLRALGVNESKWIPATQDLHLSAERLLAPSWSEPGRDPERWDYTPEGLEFVRRLFRVEAQPGSPRRVLISRERAATRRLVPTEECAKALARLGFVKVILEDLTLADQARLFARAEAIVMPTGGNLANFVHCQQGTLAVELFSPAYIPLFTPAFAGRLGLRYLPLVGEGQGKHSDAGGCEDIRFAAGLLCERVAAMLG